MIDGVVNISLLGIIKFITKTDISTTMSPRKFVDKAIRITEQGVFKNRPKITFNLFFQHSPVWLLAIEKF